MELHTSEFVTEDTKEIFSICFEAPKSASFTFPEPSDNIFPPYLGYKD